MILPLPRLILPVALGSLLTCHALHADPLPDFSLEDVNATSPRFGDSISPRDYLQQVSAYYFGTAT